MSKLNWPKDLDELAKFILDNDVEVRFLEVEFPGMTQKFTLVSCLSKHPREMHDVTLSMELTDVLKCKLRKQKILKLDNE